MFWGARSRSMVSLLGRRHHASRFSGRRKKRCLDGSQHVFHAQLRRSCAFPARHWQARTGHDPRAGAGRHGWRCGCYRARAARHESRSRHHHRTIAGSSRRSRIATDLVPSARRCGIRVAHVLRNVANLLLARTAARRRELAVRSALGAGRHRVVRQLLTESLVLALLGGAAGAAVGIAILKVAPALIPSGLLPAGVTLEFDGRVLAFCAVTAFVVAIAFGAAPARQATGVSLVELMMSGSRASSAHGAGLRRALAVVQIAVSVLLLCGAGLLLRTLFVLEDVDSGSRATTPDDGGQRSVCESRTSAARTVCNRGGACNFTTRSSVKSVRCRSVKNAGWGSALPLGGFGSRWRPRSMATRRNRRACGRWCFTSWSAPPTFERWIYRASWPAFRRS